MAFQTIRVPIPPTILITFVLAMLLLYMASLISPGALQGPLLLLLGGLIVVVSFTSIELTLYLVIMATLLSPELTFGGGTAYEIAAGKISTTESRGVTIRLDDVLLTLVCLTWLFRIAIYSDVGVFRRTPINQPVLWYWLATLFSTILGYYSGHVGEFGFFFVLKYLEYFLLFYMVINHLNDRDTIKRFLFLMLMTCFIASLIGIGEIPSGTRVSAPFEGAEGEPNTFGGYLMLLFSIVLGLFIYARNNKRRLLLGVLMGVIIVPFVYTESRSSYLAFVASMALFLIFSEKRKMLVIMAMISLLLSPILLPKNAIERISYTFTQSEEQGQLKVGNIRVDTSTSERLKAWGNVLTKQFPRHPVFGVGVTGGDFLDAQYPRVLLETGIIGLIMFLWLLRRIWIMIRQVYKETDDPLFKGVALGTLCGYGGMLVHAVGANTFIIVRIMEPFMILIGMLFAISHLDRAAAVGKPESSDGGLQSGSMV